MTFTLNGQAIFTTYSSGTAPPYTFTWHTAHWVDGAYTLGVYARMSDGTNTSSNPAAESVVLTNGNSPTITTGTVPAAGQPEIVGAVGSGADGAPGSNNVANEVRGWSPNLF